MKPGYKYLASPYSHKDPLTRELRYLAAAGALQTLLANRIWTYSPIVHCHELAKLWEMPSDAEFWAEYDETMVCASTGIFVLMIEGWAKSVGVTGEIKLAAELGKTITYLTPGDILNAASSCTINHDSRQPSAKGI